MKRQMDEPQRQKTYLLTCAPNKTQISLRIRRIRRPCEENLHHWLKYVQ